MAAAQLTQDIGAVVSRGGRPDLAGDALPKVQASTLLIVGGNDNTVIELNEMARDQMRCEVKLAIIPGATHLFEEPGALEQVAKFAGDWFVTPSHSQMTNSECSNDERNDEIRVRKQFTRSPSVFD